MLDPELHGLRDAVSGAVPSAARSGPPTGWKKRDIRATVARLTQRIVAAGGRLLHGNHPTLVPVTETAATTAARAEGARPVDAHPISYYVVVPFQNDEQYDEFFAERRHDRYARIHPFGDRASDRNAMLAEMRDALIGECHVMVCVGGELHQDKIRLPGVGEEAKMAAGRGLPVLVAGAAGGYASRLLDDHPAVRDAVRRCGLSERDGDDLARTAGPARAVSLIMRSLASLAAGRG